VPIRHLIDLYRRGQRTASQAGDFFDGKYLLGVCILAVGNAKMALKRLIDAVRAFHMAGRADTNVNNMTPDGTMAKLVKERRDTHDARRRDLRQFTDALQRLLGQIAEVALDGLQDLQHIFGSRADFLHSLVYKC
jgi:hypothetical protein